MSKITFKPTVNRMTKEELQGYLKAKRQGNGSHKSKKDYNRKDKSWRVHFER
jgi:hypothetical protein